jgi:hypothetical protein
VARAHVTVRVAQAGGFSARVRVPASMRYRALAGLLDALQKAGVGAVTLSVE